MQTLFLFILLILSFNVHSLDIHKTRLSNGLRVFVIPNSNSPIVSCRLYYLVGSVNEGPGTTGLSHMYEHMMFKGTKRVGTTDYEAEKPYLIAIDSIDRIIQSYRAKGYSEDDSVVKTLNDSIFSLLEEQRQYIIKDEIWSLYQGAGATSLNAWTSDDLTAYTVTLPSNRVELFFNIEADRMENLVLREFHSERDVVTEELFMRYTNRPVSNYFLNLRALHYSASPLGIPTIGWYSDIRNYSTDLLRDHIKQFYRPDNAVIVLSGDIDTTTAFTLADKYFSHIERPEAPVRQVVTREPKPIGEKRFTVYANSNPRIDILYHTTGFPSKDLYKLELTAEALSGKSGRLYRRLVDTEDLCLAAGAFNQWKKNDGYFHIWAIPKEGADISLIERIIEEELQKIARDGLTESEMIRAQNSIEFRFAQQILQVEQISDLLATFEKLGNWEEIFNYRENLQAVDSVEGIVETYLNPRYKTVGILITEEKN